MASRSARRSAHWIVDSTVQEKAIAHPTDSKLFERARQHLVKLAGEARRGEAGLALRQNYNREAPRLAVQVGRYVHAKQYKRMRASLKKLKTEVGRVWRDVERQRDKIPGALRGKASDLLAKAKCLLAQKQRDKNKLYSLHAPEVECIAKGKTRQPHEFGVKVSIATTHKEGLVVGTRSMPGNPYEGHTLYETLEQVAILTEHHPRAVFVDLGYRGAEGQAGTQVHPHKLKRDITGCLRLDIQGRSAIEPAIDHMKNDGRLRRNWFKGADGDALNALLCGCGHNLRMILRKLRFFFAFIVAWLASMHLTLLACTVPARLLQDLSAAIVRSRAFVSGDFRIIQTGLGIQRYCGQKKPVVLEVTIIRSHATLNDRSSRLWK